VNRHQRDLDFIRFAALDASRPTRVRRRRLALDTNAEAIAYILAVAIIVGTFAIVAIIGHR
jgi:hypothetical protein